MVRHIGWGCGWVDHAGLRVAGGQRSAPWRRICGARSKPRTLLLPAPPSRSVCGRRGVLRPSPHQPPSPHAGCDSFLLSLLPCLPAGQEDYCLDLQLHAPVDPERSRFEVLGTKIEIKLQKAEGGRQWPGLEAGSSAAAAAAAPAVTAPAAAAAPAAAEATAAEAAPKGPTPVYPYAGCDRRCCAAIAVSLPAAAAVAGAAAAPAAAAAAGTAPPGLQAGSLAFGEEGAALTSFDLPFCSKKVDWDKVAEEVEKEEKEEKPEGDQASGRLAGGAATAAARRWRCRRRFPLLCATGMCLPALLPASRY